MIHPGFQQWVTMHAWMAISAGEKKQVLENTPSRSSSDDQASS